MTDRSRKYYFEFPNKKKFLIEADDQRSAEIVDKFSNASTSIQKPVNPFKPDNRLIVKYTKQKKRSSCLQFRDVQQEESAMTLFLEPEKLLRFPLRDPGGKNTDHRKKEYMTRDEWMWRQLSILTSVVGSYSHESGGFLIHSALAEYKGKGVLLAGASGSGKTTMSKFFKSPWISHSDDLVIVIPEKEKGFNSMPMPTWSSIFGKKNSLKKTRWETTKSVPVNVVIFFEHGRGARLEKAGPAKALCLLTELAKQSNELLLSMLDKRTLINFNKSYFLNIHEMVKKIPAYILRFSLDSDFLGAIESIDELK